MVLMSLHQIWGHCTPFSTMPTLSESGDSLHHKEFFGNDMLDLFLATCSEEDDRRLPECQHVAGAWRRWYHALEQSI